MKTFFTSDNHFYHKNILKFCPATRQGADHIECAEYMIRIWNEQVSPNDLVYLLGDFSFTDREQTDKLLYRLNGRKILVKGNHDKWLNENTKKHFELVSDYLVHKIDGIDVIMFHYPIIEWDKMHYGSFHLYGHVHGKDMKLKDRRALDVGIDARPKGDMRLWEWDEIKKILLKRPIVAHH